MALTVPTSRWAAHRQELGKGVWSSPDGCGLGEGDINLRVKYTPFDHFTRHPRDSVTVSAPHSQYNLILQCCEAPQLAAAALQTSCYCSFFVEVHFANYV